MRLYFLYWHSRCACVLGSGVYSIQAWYNGTHWCNDPQSKLAQDFGTALPGPTATQVSLSCSTQGMCVSVCVLIKLFILNPFVFMWTACVIYCVVVESEKGSSVKLCLLVSKVTAVLMERYCADRSAEYEWRVTRGGGGAVFKECFLYGSPELASDWCRRANSFHPRCPGGAMALYPRHGWSFIRIPGKDF